LTAEKVFKLKISFKVGFVFSGGGQVFTYIAPSGDSIANLYEFVDLLADKDPRFHALREQINAIGVAGGAQGLFERVFYRGGLVYGFKASTVKGFLRSLWDRAVFEKFITVRLGRLGSENLVGELELKVLGGEVGSLLPDEVKRLGGEAVERIVSLYLASASPYSCQGLSLCGRTEPAALNELTRLNNRVLNVCGGDPEGCGCVRVDDGWHCVPLAHICVSCALFGSQRFASMVRFSNFAVSAEKPHLFTFLRKMAKDSAQSPFTFEVLGLDEPVDVVGEVRVVCAPERVRALLGLSYLGRAGSRVFGRVLDGVGGGSLDERLRSLAGSCSEPRHECCEALAELYRGLFEALLMYAKSGGIGIGRRSRVGMGLIVGEPRVEEVR